MQVWGSTQALAILHKVVVRSTRDTVLRKRNSLRIPEQSDHRIRSKVTSHSGGK